MSFISFHMVSPCSATKQRCKAQRKLNEITQTQTESVFEGGVLDGFLVLMSFFGSSNKSIYF